MLVVDDGLLCVFFSSSLFVFFSHFILAVLSSIPSSYYYSGVCAFFIINFELMVYNFNSCKIFLFFSFHLYVDMPFQIVQTKTKRREKAINTLIPYIFLIHQYTKHIIITITFGMAEILLLFHSLSVSIAHNRPTNAF